MPGDTARTRTGLVAPLDADDIRLGAGQLRTAFDLIETLVPLDSQGTSAPAGTGKRGEWYYRTSTGEVFRSTGSAWVNVGAMISPAAIVTALIADANVTADKLADAAKLGLTDGTSVRRGKSIIATAETRTNTAYGLMTTPDRVQNVVLPADGLLYVSYVATVRESVEDAARAAVFIGATQCTLAAPGNGSLNTVDSGRIRADQGAGAGVMDFYMPTPVSVAGASYTLGNFVGLATGTILGRNAVTVTGDVTHYLGFAAIYAAAGTYDVSVQYKASSGSVTAKDRKLWVLTQGF